MERMSEYKGHRITTAITALSRPVMDAIYRVDRRDGDGWKLAHRGILSGPFNTADDAHATAGAAGRAWVDQHE